MTEAEVGESRLVSADGPSSLNAAGRPHHPRGPVIARGIPEPGWVAAVLRAEGLGEWCVGLARGNRSVCRAWLRQITIGWPHLSLSGGVQEYPRVAKHLRGHGVELDRLSPFRGAILHEVAHATLPPGSQHGREFRARLLCLIRQHAPEACGALAPIARTERLVSP